MEDKVHENVSQTSSKETEKLQHIVSLLKLDILDLIWNQAGKPKESVIPRVSKRYSECETKRNIGDFAIGQLLGRGGFGCVKVATKGNKKYAMKIISKERLANVKWRTFKKDQLRLYQQMQNEISIWKSLNHPNIAKFITMLHTESNLYIICEYASGGTLLDRLSGNTELKEQKLSQQNNNGLSTSEILRYSQQLVSALNHMHSIRICHCDVKPENCLLNSDGNLKLTDFGLSLSTESQYDGSGIHGIHRGTVGFMPPELLTQNKCAVVDYFQVDSFSLGMSILEIMVGELKYSEYCDISFRCLENLDHGEQDILPHEIESSLANIVVLVKERFSHREEENIGSKKLMDDLLNIALQLIRYDPDKRTRIVKLHKSGKGPFIAQRNQSRRDYSKLSVSTSSPRSRTPTKVTTPTKRFLYPSRRSASHSPKAPPPPAIRFSPRNLVRGENKQLPSLDYYPVNKTID